MIKKIRGAVLMLLFFIANRSVAQFTRGTLGVTHFEHNNTLEGLSGALAHADSDTNRVRLYIKFSSIYWRKERENDLDSSLYFANQALELARRLNDVHGQNEALFLKCKVFTRRNDPKSATGLLSQVNGDMKIRLLLVISEYYVFLPEVKPVELDSANLYLKRASQLALSMNSAYWQRYCFLLSGKYYFERGDFNLGKKYFLQIIENYKNTNDILGQAKY